MDFLTYSERLGLGFDDTRKQQMFINKMNNYINNNRAYFPNTIEKEFASEIGLRFKPTFEYLFQNPIEELGNVWQYIELFKDFKQKLAAIVSLVNFLKKTGNDNESCSLKKVLIDALESSHVLFRVDADEDGIFIFPKGDPLLDEEEILRPLTLLEKYPDSEKSFQNALKAYNNLDDSNASTVADYCRKALESFFQEFFNSNKSIENLKSEYGIFLKSKGVSSELSGNLVSLLTAYTNYNNNNAKHHDKASVLLIEYLLYETGNIIRLLISLKESDT